MVVQIDILISASTCGATLGDGFFKVCLFAGVDIEKSASRSTFDVRYVKEEYEYTWYDFVLNYAKYEVIPCDFWWSIKNSVCSGVLGDFIFKLDKELMENFVVFSFCPVLEVKSLVLWKRSEIKEMHNPYFIICVNICYGDFELCLRLWGVWFGWLLGL